MKVQKSPTRLSNFSSPTARSSHPRTTNTALSNTYSSLRHSSSNKTPPSSLSSRIREPTNIIENTANTTTNSLKRKYNTSSPFASPSRSTVGTISRSDTFASEYEEGNPHKWTKHHWKKLEQCYIRKNRDYEKAASEFYYLESLQDMLLPDKESADGKPISKEFWSKEQILWRCKCLDTSAKFHGGVLPSERKKLKRTFNASPGLSSSSTSPSTTSTSTIDLSSAERLKNLINNRRI